MQWRDRKNKTKERKGRDEEREKEQKEDECDTTACVGGTICIAHTVFSTLCIHRCEWYVSEGLSVGLI